MTARPCSHLISAGWLMVVLCFFGIPKICPRRNGSPVACGPGNSFRLRAGGAARTRTLESKLLKSLMSRLNWMAFVEKLRSVPAVIFLCSLAFVLNSATPALGQDFTLSASPFSPYAINQGGSTLSTVTLNPVNGFADAVSLACTFTGGNVTGTVNPCQMSPTSVTPPATASLTFSAIAGVNPGSYVVTVTGTSGSLTHQQSLDISVLAVAPSFTVTVIRPMQPNSVHAGVAASAALSINPVNNYTGSVWLSCATIAPPVVYPPTCSFAPTTGGGGQPVQVSPTGAIGVTMTVSTLGNAQIAGNAAPRGKFYALWLPLPMLAFVGIGAASSKRSRKMWALLGLVILAGSLILTIGCGNTTTGNTAPKTSIITPKNTYTFTVIGVDGNGTISTNSGTGAPSVTLTVD